MTNIEYFNSALQQLEGQIAWQAKPGHGSFITMEFGEPHITIREPILTSTSKILSERRLVIISGVIHFWIQDCQWEILRDGKMAAHNESSKKIISKSVRFIDGQKLVFARREGISNKYLLYFDLGCILIITPRGGVDDVQLSIYKHSNGSISLMGDGSVVVEGGYTLITS